jgi:hypothetical protein
VISATIAKVLGGVILLLLVLLGIAGWRINSLTDDLVTERAAVLNWERVDKENRETYARELAEAKKRAADAKVKHDAEIKSTVADLEAAKRQRDRERAAAERERLRLPASICPPRAGTETGPGGAAGRGDDPAGIELPREVERRLRDLADEANRNTDQLRAAQAVIRACYKAQSPRVNP